MRYVDAGYVIALTVLFAYGVGLVLRRRRLARAAAVAGVVAAHPVDDGAAGSGAQVPAAGAAGPGATDGR